MKGLYLVTDCSLCRFMPLDEVVMRAVEGGASCVQLREKDLSTRRFVEEASRIKKILEPSGVPLIINDRVDVALAVRAEGVHLGQEDMPYEEARRILGKDVIIGVSVETWEDVEKVRKLDCDYIGVSPVYKTPTKTDTKGSWGLEGLSSIRACLPHPLVAIGGLNAANTREVVLAGADSIAVVSAICSAQDPYAASRELHGIIAAAVAMRDAR